MHAKFDGHSEFVIHSGRQFGGDPKNSGIHEHDGESPTALHCEFGPHGVGWHGFEGTTTGSSSAKIFLVNNRKILNLR